MSPTGTSLILPESFKAYLRDRHIRVGVDSLLTIRDNNIPHELQWHDLGKYLAARAAAELTRHEFSVALYQIWEQVWHPVFARWLQPHDPVLSKEEGEYVTPADCWINKEFTYWLSGDNGLWVGTGIGFDEDEAILSVVWDCEADYPLCWKLREEWANDDYPWHHKRFKWKHDAPEQSLSELSKAAKEAIRMIDNRWE
jgi:hypothetical protein